MKKLVSVLLISFFSLPLFAAGQTIGVVDMRKAITTVSAGQKAMEKIKKEFKAKEKEFQTKEKKLIEMRKEIEKKALALTEEQKRKKAMEFQEKMVAFQQEVRKSQEAIALRERELTAPILTELQKQIAVIAKEKGYGIVMQKNEQNLLFVANKFDFTDELIKKFNSTFKSKKKN